MKQAFQILLVIGLAAISILGVVNLALTSQAKADPTSTTTATTIP